MPIVKLKKAHSAALDGVNVVDYQKGDEVAVSDDVAEHWAASGFVAGGRRAPAAAGHQEKAESEPDLEVDADPDLEPAADADEDADADLEVDADEDGAA